ncbi:hypothetical protein UFOVP155_17 [uncultured Caudovirales phage]|uniref:Phage tail lysozyme domain-containing protein n=1 Tax=uncultured Caudovirales phage TaxID=2100421 RepID=A0A6J7W8I9_9CAUD|nr:hypothetical protein UFOVP155_17 [uncultured Caudovirales phage]
MDQSQIEFAKQKMQYLLSQGVDPQRAAAMVGNAWHESSLKPTILGDKGDSFGLYQFNKRGELPAYQDWAAQNGKDLSDWKAQTDFVLNRLQSPAYASTWKKMGEAKDVAGSTEAFMRGYERPKESAAALDSRIDLANKASGLASDSSPQTQIAYQVPQGSQTGLLGAVMPQALAGQMQSASTSLLPQTNQMSMASVPQGLLSQQQQQPNAQVAQIQPQAPSSDMNWAGANTGLASLGAGLMAAGAEKPISMPMGQVHRPQMNPNLFAGLLRKPWDV